MLKYLSGVNRRRLFVRAERMAQEQARQKELLLTLQERDDVTALLDMFAPKYCGQDLVRMGPELDGGYLLPDDLDGIVAMYSPGVSDTLGFDLEIAQKGIPCFLADGTVEQPANMHPNMQFEKMMIGDGPAETFMTLESWVERTAPEGGDLILQMDIEGAEYDVLNSTSPALLQRFRIIVLELHQLDRYLLGEKREVLSNFMNRLLANHSICHLHANTVTPPVTILNRQVPPLLELTFIRNDRLGAGAGSPAIYPHPLDAPNDTVLPQRDYPAFWGQS